MIDFVPYIKATGGSYMREFIVSYDEYKRMSKDVSLSKFHNMIAAECMRPSSAYIGREAAHYICKKQ
jgi:hypothetical protein